MEERQADSPRVETNEEKYRRLLSQVLCRLEEAAQAHAINFKDYVTKETLDFWRYEKANVRNKQVIRHQMKQAAKMSRETYDILTPKQRDALGLPATWKSMKNFLAAQEQTAA